MNDQTPDHRRADHRRPRHRPGPRARVLHREARVRDSPRRSAPSVRRALDRGGASGRARYARARAGAEGVPAGVQTGIRLATSDAVALHADLKTNAVDVDELLRWPGVPPMFALRDQDGNRLDDRRSHVSCAARRPGGGERRQEIAGAGRTRRAHLLRARNRSDPSGTTCDRAAPAVRVSRRSRTGA